MPEVVAIKHFEHGKTRSVGSRFHVSDIVADRLVKRGLVRIYDDDGEIVRPTQAAGEKSSASQAGRVSQQRTATGLDGGALKAGRAQEPKEKQGDKESAQEPKEKQGDKESAQEPKEKQGDKESAQDPKEKQGDKER